MSINQTVANSLHKFNSLSKFNLWTVARLQIHILVITKRYMVKNEKKKLSQCQNKHMKDIHLCPANRDSKLLITSVQGRWIIAHIQPFHVSTKTKTFFSPSLSNQTQSVIRIEPVPKDYLNFHIGQCCMCEAFITLPSYFQKVNNPPPLFLFHFLISQAHQALQQQITNIKFLYQSSLFFHFIVSSVQAQTKVCPDQIIMGYL